MNIIDRQDYKLSIEINNVLRPSNMKVIYFTGKEYDSKDNLTNKNTYQFFLTKEELKKLVEVLNNV